MVLSDIEAIDLITRLIIIHVPDSLDRINALEKLSIVGKQMFSSPSINVCPECGAKTMVCTECGDFQVTYNTEVTVRVNGKEIYTS